MPADKFHVSMTPEVVAEVERRGARSTIITRDLDRYYYMLARTRPSLRRMLEPNEIALICDACNGTLWQAQTVTLLPASIEDAIQGDELDQKWQIDGPALLAKLRQLDPLQMFALVDAVERFWEGPYHKDDADWGQVLV